MIKGSRPSLLALKIVANVFVNKRGITIKDISRNLKTDYKNVYDTVNALFKTGIIRKEKIGNYNLCSVNMDYDDLIIFLSEHNIYNKLKPFKSRYPTEYRIIKEACRKNIENTPCFVCLVFGSYSRGEEKRISDIDLLFLTPSRPTVNFSKSIAISNMPYQKKFHVIAQSIENFIKDLKKNKLNIATEISKDLPIVFHGIDIFFSMIVRGKV